MEAEDYRELREEQKIRRQSVFEANMEVINQSGLFYEERNGGSTLLFRSDGKPAVDFYPSTSRWKVAGNTSTILGNAKAFLEWYRKQSVSKHEPQVSGQVFTVWADAAAASRQTKRPVIPTIGGWILK